MVKTTETSVDARIGANIAVARKAAELSQAALAKTLTEISGLEWNERLIARLESGDRPLRYSEAISLAQALNVPVNAFLDGTADTMTQTAEIARVGRAMKALAEASHTLSEGLNAMAAAQGEYRLAAMAAHTQLEQTWSDEELSAVRAIIQSVWEETRRVSAQFRDTSGLPGTKGA